MLALRAVLDAKPDVFNHNVETIPRLYKCVRSQAIFERSYGFLSRVRGKDSQLLPFQ
jgi:lipoic acid synthetase